ncbi:ELWxxDGT repeat protein [Pontibacter sp. 13R65]|uniref:ELWxxDGT repeat protein n=1 Tax=Pontibacter sp. 13R65 TaxID=3127458 RepID=UPI00301C4B5F
MNHKLLLLLLLTFIPAQVNAQRQLTHILDEDSDLPSSPSEFCEYKGKVYFAASSDFYGEELWVSDGTEANTKLFVDLNPGPGYASPKSLLILNNELFFIAADGTGGHQVFKINKNNDEVERVTDFTDKYIKTLTIVGDQIFFLVDDNGYLQLWKTDGSKAGTTFIKTNISTSVSALIMDNIQISKSVASFEGSLNGLFYFELSSFTNTGASLWRSDGTTAGTILLADRLIGNGAGTNGLGSGGTSYLTQHIFYKNYLYFVTESGIMKTDGSVVNTETVVSINNGSNFVGYTDVVELDDKMYFSFFVLHNNRHFIWESDGTNANTRLVYDTNSSQYFAPSNLLPKDGKLLFTSKGATEGSTSIVSFNPKDLAVTSIIQLEDGMNKPDSFYFGRMANMLYNLNGSIVAGVTKRTSTTYKSSYFINIEAGTKEVGPDIYYTNHFHPYKNKFFFSALTPKQGVELWITDGVPANTGLLKNIHTGKMGLNFSMMKSVGNSIVFGANDPGTGVGYELMRYDSKTKVTSVLTDINKGAASSTPQDACKFKSKLFFSALQPETGRQLWVTDGTSDGTSLVSDMVPGQGSSSPTLLTNVCDHTLYFRISNDSRDHLMITDGSSITKLIDVGVNSLGNSNWITNIIAAGEKAYFSVSGGGDYLWASDGTEAGTVKIKDLKNIYQLTYGQDGYVYIVANQTGSSFSPLMLWKSDGTATGTKPVFEPEQLPLTNIRDLFAYNNAMYFVASNESSGNEIWKTDGTFAGTSMLKEIAPGKLSAISNPNFTIYNNKLYFAATDGEHGTELWSTDGTAANTVMVHDIAEGAHGSFPGNLTLIEDKMYFSATTPAYGTELWVTNGSSFTMVADILPGENHSAPSNIMSIDKEIFFMANTASEGRQLWSLANGVVANVEDDIFTKSLTVFPNPATDHLTVDYDGLSGGRIKNISIFDMVGRKQEVATSLEGKKVHIGNLTPGIYLITFEIGQERFTRKFIKQSM